MIRFIFAFWNRKTVLNSERVRLDLFLTLVPL